MATSRAIVIANCAIIMALTARDVSRLPALWTTVAFAAWADLGFGISRELIAPSETKMPAVKAAQRVPCVIASYRIERTAGAFRPKLAMKDGAIPPESPELSAGAKSDLNGPKMMALAARAACPTADIWATNTAPITAIPKAEPICLTVLLAPDPTPAFCQGMLSNTVLVSWLIARPTPAP